MQTALNVTPLGSLTTDDSEATSSVSSEASRAAALAALALPSAEQFFWGAITSGSLAHGYVLKGRNTAALYHLALTVAQIANCIARPQPPESFTGRLADLACGQCKACRWVLQNAHPAVLTISRLTYQIDDSKQHPELISSEALEKLANKANWPTQIKTGQVEVLIHQLSVSSDAVRVVIFTDAEELPATFPSAVTAPCEWRSLEATKERAFHLRPLQRNLFNAASVNRFLKILEEPPPRTLFFFLAETEEQLLETVVSRCQVVPCLGANPDAEAHGESKPEAYQDFLQDFTARLSQSEDAFAAAADFEGFFVQEHGLKLSQALELMQQHLRETRITPALQERDFTAYKAAQSAIDEALRMLASKTNEGQSLLNLFLTLGKVFQGR